MSDRTALVRLVDRLQEENKALKADNAKLIIYEKHLSKACPPMKRVAELEAKLAKVTEIAYDLQTAEIAQYRADYGDYIHAGRWKVSLEAMEADLLIIKACQAEGGA